MAANITSYPSVTILFNTIGIIPLWNPKITKICQNPPINAPKTIGLSLYRTSMSQAMIFDIQVAAGPIAIKDVGTTTNKVINGTKKFDIDTGLIFLANFWT